jgi:hypothetical protein
MTPAPGNRSKTGRRVGPVRGEPARSSAGAALAPSREEGEFNRLPDFRGLPLFGDHDDRR